MHSETMWKSNQSILFVVFIANILSIYKLLEVIQVLIHMYYAFALCMSRKVKFGSLLPTYISTVIVRSSIPAGHG